jgi:hypothetical protein
MGYANTYQPRFKKAKRSVGVMVEKPYRTLTFAHLSTTFGPDELVVPSRA